MAISLNNRLEKFQFNRDIKSCPKEMLGSQISAAAAAGYEGKWFCETKSYSDWQGFYRWKTAQETSIIADALSKWPVFDPGPTFNVSQYNGHGPSKSFLACQAIAAKQNSAALRRCVIDEENRHDVVLNAAYRCIQNRSTLDTQAKLKEAQRQWIVRRKVEYGY